MGYSFTRSTINENASTSPGVYLIYKESRNIYAGQSQNIRGRLLEHYDKESDQSDCIWSYSPTAFIFEVVWDSDARNRTEQEWIRKYRPACNQ